jgi:hypothetical protein
MRHASSPGPTALHLTQQTWCMLQAKSVSGLHSSSLLSSRTIR